MILFTHGFAPPELPDDIATLKAELALARARNADDAATIARQKLKLEDLEAAATEDEIAAEQTAARTTKVAAFTRKRPSRQPFPAHLPLLGLCSRRPAIRGPRAAGGDFLLLT